MRLGYMQIGDNFNHDEYNAFVSILLLTDTSISENIKLNPTGYLGKFATYYFEYSEQNIDYRETDIRIFDHDGELKVTCVSDSDATFRLHFNDKVFESDDEGVIIIDLTLFSESLATIPNHFIMDIVYNTPYIKSKPNPTVITKTSELRELIDTVEEGDTITLGADLEHNIRKSIQIKTNCTIDCNNKGISGNGIATEPLFHIDNDAKLKLVNADSISNLKTKKNGAVFNNEGILIVEDSVFDDCYAEGEGAVCYNSYGESYFDTCEFNNCTAQNGGAIYNKGD